MPQERYPTLSKCKVMALKARHSSERLLIQAMSHMAAPLPSPVHRETPLRNVGTSERGVSTLSALVTLLPSHFPAARLDEVNSPFVSNGEILIPGELAMHQRIKPEALRGGRSISTWP